MTVAFTVGRVEHTRPHLLADTVELSLLFGPFDQIAEGDVLTIIQQNPRAAGELLPISDPDVDDDGEDDRLGGAAVNARLQRYIEDCFRQIEFRISAFGDSYPFELRQNVLYTRQNRTEYQNLYVFLLCCSRTRSFGRSATARLADEFEIVCGHAMRKMLPPTAEVYLFGPNARRAGGVFSTNLVQAIPTLAERMGSDLAANWNRNLNPQGDGKIDLVGIVPFDRFSTGYHVILGQCASMEDESNWERKRLEALSAPKRGFFAWLVDPQAMLFIPACFRSADGQWVDINDVAGVVPLDRLRILHVFQSANDAPVFAEASIQNALRPAAVA